MLAEKSQLKPYIPVIRSNSSGIPQGSKRNKALLPHKENNSAHCAQCRKTVFGVYFSSWVCVLKLGKPRYRKFDKSARWCNLLSMGWFIEVSSTIISVPNVSKLFFRTKPKKEKQKHRVKNEASRRGASRKAMDVGSSHLPHFFFMTTLHSTPST